MMRSTCSWWLLAKWMCNGRVARIKTSIRSHYFTSLAQIVSHVALAQLVWVKYHEVFLAGSIAPEHLEQTKPIDPEPAQVGQK